LVSIATILPWRQRYPKEEFTGERYPVLFICGPIQGIGEP